MVKDKVASPPALHLVDNKDIIPEPKRARKARLTAEQVIEALRAVKGIKLLAAQVLQCNRHTIDNYIAKYPTVKAAYDEQTQVVLDIAEGHLFTSISKGNLEQAKWFLQQKGKSRGYGTAAQMEVTGPDGGPLQVNARVLVGHLIERMALNASTEIPQVTTQRDDETPALPTGADSDKRQ